ncbi:RagB/SusD family nutrient uptake outer membrane protein [Mucilaginibacter sp. HMF5004]|uniref:RagB/SusD family nutrient uptake outer membrane protein n=1 Tax=Mucilaginibacter rivuli TaxID=2857527 RepID=UPI001C5E4CB7|nr:RagB/SusD family nutrient uptake outer membrane protein [Mucilaginibacter rivuli]MBW4891876.1 RagB/SusD family nutrient uptake outer membrane protein [Mucilaginibacter rivuli]
MKKLYKRVLIAFAVICSLNLFSCKKVLDEYNPSGVTLDLAYNNKTGYEGLINACYTDMYFFYGKVDWIGPSEMGTDLWQGFSSTDNGLTIYDNTLNTGYGTIKTCWGGWYSCINLCNTAISYSKTVKGYATPADVNAKVAEAYFMRAWCNFNLVEQFGGVVLRTESSAVTGVELAPVRSSETAFYDLIISDLQFACANLPLSQTLRGRVAKKAAYAMLAKACLQRTRLGDVQKYAKMALDASEELINNQAKYGCALYLSDAAKSGFAKEFDNKNNKNNSEFLWVQAIDVNGNNPDFFNRGRTHQYYLPDLGGKGLDWGQSGTSILYGRANARQYKPSSYLLTKIFDPRENTPDTRFANTFFYKFYATNDKLITPAIVTTYQKDPSLANKTILGTAAFYSGPDYYLGTGATLEEEKNMTNDAGLSVFTPNWNIPAATKKSMLCLVADPSDLFDATGAYKTTVPATEVNLTSIFPALRKFSGKFYSQTNQQWLGDFGILRLGETYLIAAEAALLLNNDQAKAVGYVNTIRKRAALTTRESEMVALPSEMTVSYILAERGRELAGEHTRWIDLKRTGNLSKTYLQATNPIVAVNFDPNKHIVRPIPQSFLDAIVNAKDFGTNGY